VPIRGDRPDHLASHTSRVSLALGVLPALLLLIVPGTLIGITAGLRWPIAVATGPALTYGVVGLAIVPLGFIGWPWNGWTALFAVVLVAAIVGCLRLLLTRYRDRGAEDLAPSGWPVVIVAAGIVLGVVLIGAAAMMGLTHWQSVPSTWDAVWHANEIRYILDTGQASPTHMGELRNVETHATLYYPSAFHALASVLSQLTGAAPTTVYTASSLVAAVWLFPISAATLTWQMLRTRTDVWRTAGCAAAAAAMSASFTAIPYVEFDTASMPNLAAYGMAAPTMVLIVSALRHRDRIPVAVLALLGVFSVHTTGGVVVALFVAAWWAFDGLWRPVRGRWPDVVTLLLVALPSLLLLLPQFKGIIDQADIIVGHAFVTHEGKKKALFDAIVGHTRHLNDFPIQNALIAMAAAGGLILLIRKIWWPAAVWLLLVAAIVHSSAPFGTVLGSVLGKFSDLFYSDPRRLFAVITLLLAPFAGIALFTLASAAVTGVRRLVSRRAEVDPRVWPVMTAAVMVAITIGYAWHYFPRHKYLLGQKYDSVMIDHKDLEAMAYLATLPGARDTLIGDANVDGTAWMYAVAGLHPLWTHYDYPVQQGPGYNRYIFWVYADDADTDPRVAEAVRALGIRYVMTSVPVVREFVMPDGLASLDKSKSWEKIYDNGGARIYEWRGGS
jgi:D-galactosaminyltransferase